MTKRAAIMAVLLLAACTDETGARRALQDAGLKPESVGGYALLGCEGQSDQFRTRFTATNANGRHVRGVVCRGWFKASTIRFF
jgi:hypothetical protein